ATARPRADVTSTPSQAAQAGGSGPYAVQLGAPGSDAEARGLISKTQARFGGALGAYKPTIRKATVGDKDVYRVRVVGLSLEGANDLCGKLKASGGACFVARN
ncbi:MAG: Sporulation domain protein, partial [Hyphomicrobiales bacterium]|nr:Sporulation domain protein [Hyphomicrobiales bacterium]